jgi:hypothetical protein
LQQRQQFAVFPQPRTKNPIYAVVDSFLRLMITCKLVLGKVVAVRLTEVETEVVGTAKVVAVRACQMYLGD